MTALALDPAPPQDGTVTYYAMLSAASFGDDLRAKAIEALRGAWSRSQWNHRFGLPDAFNPDALQAFPAAARVTAEAESGTGGRIMQRSNASGQESVLLQAGQSLTVPITAGTPGSYRLTVRTSNGNSGPIETVNVSVDGAPLGSLQPPSTGDSAAAWNVFVDTTLTGSVDLLAGSHTVKLGVTGTAGFGVELDLVRLDPMAAASPRAWVNPALFAIDEGPTALHLENARSGLIWSRIKANPHIQRATNRLLPVQTVSAASGFFGAAPASLVSSYGSDLPEQSVTVSVLDSASNPLAATPIYEGATQANWVTPATAAGGQATVTIRGTDAPPVTGTLVFSRLAPALFSANASGKGVAAANLIRVKNSAATYEPVAVYDAASGTIIPVPIRFGGVDEQLYLELYGTGLRGNTGLGEVALSIGGVAVPVLYAGAQSQFPGLDQVDAGPLPLALAARGALDVSLAVGGQIANTVTLSFQ